MTFQSDSIFYLDSETFVGPFFCFKGYAITDSYSVFGERGFLEAEKSFGERVLSELESADGSFLVAYAEGDNLRIKSDPLGGETIFLYDANGFWAVSNSFLFLVECVKEKKQKLTLDVDILNCFLQRHSFGHQLVSSRTVYKEVSLLPSFYHLKVSGENKKVSIDVDGNRKSLITNVYSDREDFNEYVTYVGRWLKRYVSLVKSLSAKTEISFGVELSGGVDSRVNLGLFREAFKEEGFSCHDISFISQLTKKEDYRCVENMLNELSLTEYLNRDVPSLKLHKRCPPRLAALAYSYANLGVLTQDPFFPKFADSPPVLRVNGGSGGILRKYLSATPHSYSSKPPEKLYMASFIETDLKTILRDVASSYSFSLNEDYSFTIFYRLFRNRFFAGRSWLKSLNGLTLKPLNSVHLVKAVSVRGRESFLNRQIFSDILHFFSLDDFEFDDEGKKFSEKQKARSQVISRAIGELDINSSEYVVFGSPFNIYSVESANDLTGSSGGLSEWLKLQVDNNSAAIDESKYSLYISMIERLLEGSLNDKAKALLVSEFLKFSSGSEG